MRRTPQARCAPTEQIELGSDGVFRSQEKMVDYKPRQVKSRERRKRRPCIIREKRLPGMELEAEHAGVQVAELHHNVEERGNCRGLSMDSKRCKCRFALMNVVNRMITLMTRVRVHEVMVRPVV